MIRTTRYPSPGEEVTLKLETMYLDIDGPVARLMMNRPEVLNCANLAWVRDLNTIADHLMADEAVRVVVVGGEGRAFSTGIDLNALSRGEIPMSFFEGWEAGLRKLETMDKIVIAAVHSHCIGGGLQLALACDLRIARDDARFGVTAIKEGIIPGMGMWRIARFAGMGRAKRLALAADVVDAKTALQWGLVDWVVEASEFEARVEALVERQLQTAWTSTRLTKKLTTMAFEVPWADFAVSYFEFQKQSMASEEHQEAMKEYRARKG